MRDKTTDQTDTIRYDTKYQPKKEMEFVAGKWTETKTKIKMKKKKPRRELKRTREMSEQNTANLHSGHIEAENALSLAFVLALYIHYYYVCVRL